MLELFIQLRRLCDILTKHHYRKYKQLSLPWKFLWILINKITCVKSILNILRFKVINLVCMKITVVRDVTPCNFTSKYQYRRVLNLVNFNFRDFDLSWRPILILFPPFVTGYYKSGWDHVADGSAIAHITLSSAKLCLSLNYVDALSSHIMFLCRVT